MSDIPTEVPRPERSALEVDAPNVPHLAVMTAPEEWTALPPGARMLIVTDPTRADRIIPVFLVKVQRDGLVFRCNCGNPKCTRVLRYKLTIAGTHPPSQNKTLGG